MLFSFKDTPAGFRNGAPSEIEHTTETSKRAKKSREKKKDGTDGIDAVDEHSEAERFEDGFSDMDE
jgi:hypothetical protein